MNRPPNAILPSFFVVGVQKAGTTSLHHWLKQQPEVRLPWIKETHFFSQDEQYERGIDWYSSQFPPLDADSVVGEICPSYSYFPKAARRIREWVAAPKIIFIFRQPIERAFSNYQMNVRRGLEPLDFAAALKEEPRRLAGEAEPARRYFGYMARGRYAEQIERYRNVFPDCGCLFVKYEDLMAGDERGFETYRSICEFVGVRSSPAIADRSGARNPASEPRSKLIGALASRSPRLKQWFRNAFPAPLQMRASQLFERNLRPLPKQPVPPVPREIVKQAEIEIRKLESLTGWNLDDWLQRRFDRASEDERAQAATP
jgi:hypothetical protein